MIPYVTVIPFCVDLSWAVTPQLTAIPFCVDLSWAVTPQLTAIPFFGDLSWAVTPVISFSVAIINSDTTSTAMTLYLLSWEVTPNFWHCCVDVLSGAVSPYLTDSAILALMFYRGR